MNRPVRRRFDFLVFGAGHAGLAFAIHASQRGARVAVVERPKGRDKIGEVVESTLELPLRKLGVWEGFLAQPHLRSSGTVSAWHGDDPLERDALVSPFGGAWLIDRPLFDRLLAEAARGKGIDLLTMRSRPACDAHGIVLKTDQGEVRASFAIEASGRHGAAVAPSGRRRQDDLIALAAYVDASRPDLRFRLQAVPQGWWYAAPLPNGRAVVTLMTLVRLLPRTPAARLAFWREALQSADLLAPFADISAPRLSTHPASGTLRDELRGARWLAVGDAAAAYDPLHGLGIVAALTKGIAAAAILTSSQGVEVATRLYAEMERDNFRAYDEARRRLYAQGAVGRDTAFWREVVPATRD